MLVEVFFTCAVVTIHKAGYVGFGLAGYQMRRAKLFQHTIVIILIDLPLVIDPTAGEAEGKEK